ncbi:hypothetical protein [Aquiflexum lacus]|uniref:hypothetical protein n=1 Tax=Aquiflexum lacus TaxID=2483805 RepID=UPI0018962C66|nr:hypothetical protein [Aquiflexum lacus]
MKKFCVFSFLFLFFLVSISKAQDKPNEDDPAKIIGYFSYLNPLVKFSGGETINNFSNGYAMGFPTGLIYRTNSNRYGFIFELVPIIVFKEGSSRMDNLVFNPGIQFHFPKGWNFNQLLSFETSGRYGLTPVISKTLRVGEFTSWFMTIPVPIRFGNDNPTSLKLALQLGIAF